MGRESDVRWRGVGAVGLGHMARQDFARGMHRHVALSRGPVTGHCYWIPSQGTVSGHDKSSRAGEADGEVAAGRRCGAWHIPTRHNINMALRHQGCTWDNCEVQ